VLTPEQLTFCLSVLHVLADALPASGGSGSNAVLLGSVLVPNAAGILVQAKELVYNDAPWLPKSALEMTGVNRLVHTDIENELAKRLGAKSLRYLSLVDQEMTSDLPCLSTIAISDTLSGYGHDKELLLYNLLEIADCCKARKIHVLYDKRQHPRQSLLQPNLGTF
jgi:sacsin